jgi:hypothetical protein
MPKKKFVNFRPPMSTESQSQARAKTQPLQRDAPQDKSSLEAMIDQMNKTTAQASHALDEALALVADSNRRIAGMEPTVIPMGIARHGNENLVSRAQAKRIASEIEKLEHVPEVLLDFSGVQEIGQGFADQLFRVFTKSHPEVALTPIHCAPSVRDMIKRALARNEDIASAEYDLSNPRETKP